MLVKNFQDEIERENAENSLCDKPNHSLVKRASVWDEIFSLFQPGDSGKKNKGPLVNIDYV